MAESWLQSRFTRMSRWFAGDEPRAPQDPAPAEHHHEPSLIESADFSNLTLEEVLRREPGALSVTLHIVTLRAFKEVVAAEWARYARNVELICDGVFRRHLEVRHVYSLHGDDTFILSFADLPEAEATRRAAVIANELMHRLVG
ncbi:MAG: hypothetical protein KDA64_13655, partial [Rhodospirillaceae bacterium]|nr:hypothetical protein [Rhodospirillaceae bacterium]